MARCGPHAIVCQALVPKSLGETKSRYEQVPCFHQVVLVPKNPPASAGGVRDEGLIPGSGRSLGGGHVNPLQYSGLRNPMDRGAWQSAVYRVPQSQT